MLTANQQADVYYMYLTGQSNADIHEVTGYPISLIEFTIEQNQNNAVMLNLDGEIELCQ